MKIAVTNESGLTAEHLEQLKLHGDVAAYSDTDNSNVIERLRDADIAVIDSYITPVTKELLQKLPGLKFLSVNSTGYDNVDVPALLESGIVGSNVPGFSTEAVAEFAIGLMFSVVRKIPEGDREFRESPFQVDPGTEAARKYLGFDLKDKTLGVVGLGHIGMRVAEMARGVGMNVVAYNRSSKAAEGVKIISLEEVLSVSDVVVISLALSNETKGLISKERISMMKRGAILINIAGMDIVDTEALRNALNNGSIAGAGLDTAGSSMLSANNTVLTPHMAYNTKEAAENMGSIIVENILAFLSGAPKNIIS